MIRPAPALRRPLPGKRDPERAPHLQNVKCGGRAKAKAGNGVGGGSRQSTQARQLRMDATHPECRGQEGRGHGDAAEQAGGGVLRL